MATQATTKWALDPTHSEIGFKVKHLMINTVSGKFEKFDGSVETAGDDFTTAKIYFTADLSSVNTGNEQRDGHLKSDDFFSSEKHPQLSFSGSKLEKVSGDKYTLTGDLTILGVAKPVTLDVDFGGIAKDPWGNTKAGFSVTGKINRKDWGLNWNATLEAGGFLLDEVVKLNVEIQLTKQA
ncbi:MAG: polyisoprenoid-binding protein [Bacteroidota bacterium]|nr:polyisoprenoid-binding protein [Bacteroidota bacterium]